jgi:hypothetical protein
VVVGTGALYLHEGSALSDAKAERAAAEAAVTAARAAAVARAVNGGATAAVSTSPEAAVYQYARGGDVDWAGVQTKLTEVSEPLGVAFTSFGGLAEQARSGDGAAGTPTPSTTVATGSTTGSGPGVGSLSVTGTAADLDVIAAWLDATVASGHFQNAWVSSVNAATDTAGNTKGMTFTATVVVGADNLVARPQLAPVAS